MATRTVRLRRAVKGNRFWLGVSSSGGARGRMAILVEALDARMMFGRPEVLVRPIEGTGNAWVSADKIYPVEEEEG